MKAAHRFVGVTLGVAQLLSWGSSLYFPAVMARPIIAETGWPLGVVVGGLTIGLLVAALISPWVGAIIHRRGGRLVLAAGSIVFCAAMVLIGLAPNAPFYLAAWVVMGVAMGACLYDAGFAALAWVYGADARSRMTTLTLFGGLGSTVSWPLMALLIESFGWRATCFIYAALHLAIALPAQLTLPANRSDASADGRQRSEAADEFDDRPLDRLVVALIAIVLTCANAVGAILLVHLLIVLQARGASAATAVALGTLFGPGQIVARIVERLFGQRYHPIWTALGATVLMVVGMALLDFTTELLAAGVVIFAAGYGVSWVVRGALPLAAFGPRRYTRLAGRFALPSLIGMALAPTAGALLIEWQGIDRTLTVLLAAVVGNVGLTVWLWWLLRQRERTAV